jgi:MFS family permease
MQGSQTNGLPTFLGVRFLTEAAALAQSVAVGWAVYDRSHNPAAIGLVGLAQFLPMLVLTLPAGELCDRVSPKPVLAVGLLLQGLLAIALLALAVWRGTPLWPVFGILIALGAVRAFADPAGQSLLPLLVPPERLPRAIAQASTAWQVAVVAGPTIGGVAYAYGPLAGYGVCAIGFLVAAAATAVLPSRLLSKMNATTLSDRVARVREGLSFIWSRPALLGALSLDLFAVLLGGAAALLPVYAKDILHVGPAGLGVLRSSPAVGACCAALIQIHYPVSRHTGAVLFAAVGIFGLATLVFAFSTTFAPSLAALLVLGASDMVSVNIRSTLVQITTPDAMRGRVSAVNMLFVGASSELGAFESGITAGLMGTVPAVALGGLGTLVVAAIWMWAFPALRKTDRLAPASG